MKRAQKEAPKNGKKQQIFEASDRLFCERGYHGVSVQDIARAAGVNKALVFYYFGSKAALFEQVLEHYYQAHAEALSAAYEQAEELSERLHRVLDAYLDFMVSHSRYARLILQQVTLAEHRAVIERNQQQLLEWLTQVLSDVVPETGPLAARHFFVTFSGIVLNYFTYAPLLESAWLEEPMSTAALEERRQHIHWMADAVLAQLTRHQGG